MNRQTQASGNFAFHCHCHCHPHCPHFMFLFCIVTDICSATVIPELPSTSFIFPLFFYTVRHNPQLIQPPTDLCSTSENMCVCAGSCLTGVCQVNLQINVGDSTPPRSPVVYSYSENYVNSTAEYIYLYIHCSVCIVYSLQSICRAPAAWHFRFLIMCLNKNWRIKEKNNHRSLLSSHDNFKRRGIV